MPLLTHEFRRRADDAAGRRVVVGIIGHCISPAVQIAQCAGLSTGQGQAE
jgi:hypothetical protein